MSIPNWTFSQRDIVGDESTDLNSHQELLVIQQELQEKLGRSLHKRAELENKIKIQNELIEQLKTQIQKLEQQTLQLQEQLLIQQEKEKHLLITVESLKSLPTELENKQKIIFSQARTLARYRRFHERVSKQIRPYIQDVRRTALQLQEENTQLRQRINDLIREINKVQAHQLQEKEQYAAQIEQLKHYHQQDRQKDLALIQELQLEIKSLEPKSRLVDVAQYRCDQLENEIIRIKKEYQEEKQSLKKTIEKLSQEIARLKIQNLE